MLKPDFDCTPRTTTREQVHIRAAGVRAGVWYVLLFQHVCAI